MDSEKRLRELARAIFRYDKSVKAIRLGVVPISKVERVNKTYDDLLKQAKAALEEVGQK